MSDIFISYRRVDAPGYAGRIFDRLSSKFGRDHVFMDLDSIAFGEDFGEVIERTLESCSIVLVLIGPNWLSVLDTNGARRLDNESDHVLVEVKSALDLGKRVVPILVGGAQMPKASELPATIAKLSRRNAIDISDRRFNYDVEALIHAISAHLAGASQSSDARAATGELAETRISETSAKSGDLPQTEPRNPNLIRSSKLKLILLAVTGVVGLGSAGFYLSNVSSRDVKPPAATGSGPRTTQQSTESKVAPAIPQLKEASPGTSSASPASGPLAALSAAASSPVQPSVRALTMAASPDDELKNLWLTSKLYGADNEVAAAMLVRITQSAEGYLVHIANQFGFTCRLRFDESGNPSELSACASKSEPDWTVREQRIQLKCSTLKTEVVCSGRYNLVSGSSVQLSTLTIARRVAK